MTSALLPFTRSMTVYKNNYILLTLAQHGTVLVVMGARHPLWPGACA